MTKERKNKEVFISDNINEISIDDRKDILYLLYNSCHREKLKEKGNGTQIKMKDLADEMIDKIYDLINKKIKENME